MSFILGIGWGLLGIPPPPWSIGIFNLAESVEINLGAQSLRGKILSRKGLGFKMLARGRVPYVCATRPRLVMICYVEAWAQGQMSHRAVISLTGTFKN